MKKGDLYILLITILVAVITFFSFKIINNKDGERYVEIKVNQDLVYAVELTDKTNIRLLLLTTDNGDFKDIISIESTDNIPQDIKNYDIISISNNGIQVLEADCPRQIVVKQGFQDKSYFPLICVPHKLSIKIISNNSGDNQDFDSISN